MNLCVYDSRVAFLQHCVQDEWIRAGRLCLSLGLHFGGHRCGEVSHCGSIITRDNASARVIRKEAT